MKLKIEIIIVISNIIFIIIIKIKIKMDCINISGLLKNLLSSGFNTRDCIGEMLDNSIGANSKNINIILDTKQNILIFSDDGCGMTKEELGKSHILHNRTETSVDKDGCYGIGGKHARSHFTQNVGIAKTISKSIGNDKTEDIYNSINTVEIDYGYSVKNNILTIYPRDIGCKDMKIWEKYSIDCVKTGTIVYINCHPSITEEIKLMIETDNICNSISYYIASVYNETITLGTKIKLICDENPHNIEAIDPSGWETISDENKKEVIIQLYTNNLSNDSNVSNDLNDINNVYCYYKEDLFYRDYSNSDKRKNNKKISENEFNKDNKLLRIGDIILKSAYSSDWISCKKQLLENNRIEINIPNTTTFKDEITGKFYIRNKKIITRFTAEKAKSGDKCKYDFYPNSIHIIKFNASSILDKLFDININKSRIDENNINNNVNNTIKNLISNFINDMHKKHCKYCKYSVPDPIPDQILVPNPVPNPVPLPDPVPVPPSDNSKQKTEQVHKRKPEPLPKPEPPNPIQLKTNFTFSKTPQNIIIFNNKTKLYSIPYVCQYNIIEQYYKQTLENIGPEKFKKWLFEQSKLNKLL